MKKHLVGAILPVLVLAACQKTPEVAFTADKTQVLPGDTITFTNTSTEASSYSWDFDDKTFSTEVNPKKAYSDTGIFVVNLIAYSKNEKKHDQNSAKIHVYIPDYYTQFVLNGFQTSYKKGDEDLEHVYSADKNVDTLGASDATYRSSLYDGSNTVFSVEKGTLGWFGGVKPNDVAFSDFFDVGSYSYSASANNGVRITLYDGTEFWTTDGAQTGNSFSIVSKEDTTLNSYFAVHVTCKFNCVVYNASGSAKTLSGTYVGFFANI